MPEAYPLPSYACSLWVAGDDLMVAFPGQGPEERGHTIRLPASAGGLTAVIKILRERASAASTKLSARGTPSQYEVERALAHDRKYAAILGAMTDDKADRERHRLAAEAELRDLGLL
jgi:hypothetical protein